MLKKKKKQEAPRSPQVAVKPAKDETTIFPTTSFQPPDFELKHNWLDSLGYSPIHWAVISNDMEALQTLISNGVNVNIQSSIEKLLPLDFAVLLLHSSIAFVLLENGAKYTKYNPKGVFDSTGEQNMSKIAHLNHTQPNTIALQFYYSDVSKSLKAHNNWEQLIDVNLSNNSLPDVPVELFSITGLKKLNLSDNLIEHIPSQLSQLQELELFTCKNNYLSAFPTSVVDLDQLLILDLTHNQIDSIPSEIIQMRRLRQLIMAHNLLRELPKRIVECVGLEQLIVHHNYITHFRDIPIHLFLMLHTLDISHNRFTQFPFMTVMMQPEIRRFRFEGNQFPTEMSLVANCFYSEARQLDLSGLGLKTLTPEIQLLTQLQDLNLRSNVFESLPSFLSCLTNLTTLDVSFNRLRDLPLFIHRLSKLQTLNLEETKSYLVNPPKGVVDRGLKSIVGHYEDLLQGEPCFRLKLMLVGQENVGKTSILHSLLQKGKRGKKKPNISTDGIDIERWSVKTSSKQLLTFSAWDFAGQEIYYATHSFFLSTNAIYLLVWDLRYSEDCGRIDFWLNSISTRAASAPIILIGTHMDAPQFQADPSTIEPILHSIQQKYARYTSIKAILAVSTTENDGIASLMDQIRDIAMSMSNIRIPLPKIYQNLEELIFEHKDKTNPPAVNWDKFRELASAVHFKDDEQLLRAINFLNDLGSVVFFAGDQSKDEQSDMRLIVLDPQWLTTMFASVITTSHNYSKYGTLKQSDLHQIWRAPQYPPDMHGQLILLLKQFEIIFELPLEASETAADRVFLLPSLLPEEKPNIDLLWVHYDDPSLVNQFTRAYKLEFIPNGLFSRFMVRFLHFADRPLKYWKNGVIAEKGSDRALLEIEKATQTIHIVTRGEKSAEFLRVAIEILESLVTNFFKVGIVHTTVTCPHCLASGKRAEDCHQFDVGECEQLAIISGGRIVPCPKGDQSPVRLDRLIPDIVMTDFAGSQVNYNDIELLKAIGKGSFGVIFKALYQGELVAVKQLKETVSAAATASLDTPDNDDDDDDENTHANAPPEKSEMNIATFSEFRREVWLMNGINHPCIVNLKGYALDPLLMMMEFVSGGDLFTFIHNDLVDLNWPLKLKVAYDMALGMNFLHTINPPLLHRDLKSPNVLIVAPKNAKARPGQYSLSEDSVIAKVADFGLSSRLFIDSLSARAVENPTWCAPEILQRQHYSQKADVYSYGMILWELVSRELPFVNYSFQHQVEDDVIRGIRPSIPDSCWEDFALLISQCWAANPNDRPSFAHILRTLNTIIHEHYPNQTFPYHTSDTTHLPASRVESVSSASDPSLHTTSSTSTNNLTLQGSLAKCIDSRANARINCIHFAVNQIYCATDDGYLIVFSAESGQHITTFKAIQSQIFSLNFINGQLWTGGTGDMAIWVTDELVEQVQSDQAKLKAGSLVKLGGERGRFGNVARKWQTRHFVLYKSGYLKYFRNDSALQPLGEIWLKEARMEKSTSSSSKYKFDLITTNRTFSLRAISEEDLQSWWAEITKVVTRLSDVPTSQSTMRKLFPNGDPIYSMVEGGNNHVLVSGKSSVRVVDHHLRTKNLVKLDPFTISQIRSMTNTQKQVWVAAKGNIIRMNNATYKIIGPLKRSAKRSITCLCPVGAEVWASSANKIDRFDAYTGTYIATIKLVTPKLKIQINDMVVVGDSVWVGATNGISIVSKSSYEVTSLLKTKSPVQKMTTAFDLIWSTSEDQQISIWK